MVWIKKKMSIKLTLIPRYQKWNRYMPDGWLVFTTSCEILAKWSNRTSKMLQSWRQLTTTRFLMRIYLSGYLTRNTFYAKRNYLNYLSFKSYVVPFIFHFAFWICLSKTITSDIRQKIRSKNVIIYFLQKFSVSNLLHLMYTI